MISEHEPVKNHSLPAVSIIIVTLNAAGTLQNCLDSIYSLNRPDIEIIVIDGNSSDRTAEILKANEARLGCWMSEADEGIYDAMNKGLKYANAGWIYFLGADDELLPPFSDMLDELRDPTAIYHADIFAGGEIKSGKRSRYQMAKYGIYHQAMIYPAMVFERYRFDTRYKICADFALTLKLCGDKTFHFVYKNRLIANFNHTGISGREVDMAFQKDKAGLILKNFGWLTCLRYLLHRRKHRNDPKA